ncbi:RNA-binding CRS1/YhbY (CRM) domain protein [Abeliophyllum distichum]|uniref:RNA-binding CRS1/YhbY (CRM) domain protein n=1 Tax=Abeliophyllum distichum TaxID=126358 RepID=A0ABD1SH87_9LAMI
MFASARNFQKHSLRTLSSLLYTTSKNVMLARNDGPVKFMPISSNVNRPNFVFPVKDGNLVHSAEVWNKFDGARGFSAKSMRSKVEMRMRKESGKTLREIRRAKKLRKKLMTDEERLIYNLRRAKKKVSLLLQKLKKYELPELPSPRHDPELFTPEQLQAYKKIGFRNKNYVPVGVRGVFGGVVQNMHLHWKFHETVQVCCDNFPKEKIKEMASMLARLSGGIVVNIHNVKTIIMFRGRNYRQPKNLIPINTLTKRKALFKARFEQALESQKLNIKKIEQELRRKGVNPDDPVAMASIQRVAEDKNTRVESDGLPQQQTAEDDSDQEELDRFIAEIEDAADKEWAAEEEAEKENLGRIRYWKKEDLGSRFRRSEVNGSEDSDDENRGTRSRNQMDSRKKINDSDGEDGDTSELDNGWDSDDTGNVNHGSDSDDSKEVFDKFTASKAERWQQNKTGRTNFKRNEVESNIRISKQASIAEDTLSDLEDALWESDDGVGHNSRDSRSPSYHYRSSSDERDYDQIKQDMGRNTNRGSNRHTAAMVDDNSLSEDSFSE